jgi:predicted transcriptional regulator
LSAMPDMKAATDAPPDMAHASDQITPLLQGLRNSGLSDAEIARRTNMARSALWKIEQGVTRSPSLDSYLRIASTYRSHVGPPPPLKLR